MFNKSNSYNSPIIKSGDLYHGSNMKIKKPTLEFSKVNIDFGKGFYKTRMKGQAIEWGSRKNGGPIVSKYYINNISDDSLNIKYFSKEDEEWLDFIANCRFGIQHNFDIVEGPVADDQVYNWVEMYINRDITKEAFFMLCKFSKRTNQVVFCTQKSLDLLEYKGVV